MGLMSLFKKTKQSSDVSKFNFPNDDDLDVPPPPPSLEDANYDDKLDVTPEKEDFNVDTLDLGDFDDDTNKIKTNQSKSDDDFDFLEEKEEPEQPTKKQPAPTQATVQTTTQVTTQQTQFVLLEDYKFALNDITAIKTSLSTLDHEFVRIHHHQPEEDSMFKSWHSQANDILRKLNYVDKTLFEKNR